MGFNTLRDAHYRLWNPITEQVTVVHDATFVETKLSRHWYENLLLCEDPNFSGGDYTYENLSIDERFEPLTVEHLSSEAAEPGYENLRHATEVVDDQVADQENEYAALQESEDED